MSIDQPDTEPRRQQTTRTTSTGTIADRTVTFLLFLLLGFMAVALIQVGAVVSFAADVCGSDGVTCNFSVITAGAFTATWAPLTVLIIAILVAVHRLVRYRTAFWIPLIGIAAVIGVVLLAGALVDTAITRT